MLKGKAWNLKLISVNKILMQPLFWVHLLSLLATYQGENSYSGISTYLLEPAENELLLPKFKMHNFLRKIGKPKVLHIHCHF